MKKVALILIIALLSYLGLSPLLTTKVASAVSASDWRAGRIIDDNIFTDKNSMSISDIQAFLNAKVGTWGYDSVPGQCDTYGARNAAPYNGSISRATYAASVGKPTRFTCLNNYYEVPKTTPGAGVPANNYGSDTIPAGAKSAAELIWNASQAHNISPKVLLVMLHKESAGPLTVDDWPWQSQYTYAMGAHCPDSTGCDPNYAGFSIQISESAALLRWYLDNMNQPWWPYKKLGSNSILYNPKTSCGSSNVYIESMATAALYTYTPYQPNSAALANLYGTGDSCSAYGNRNFWRIYNDWFGPTTALLNGVVMTNISQPDLTPARGQTVTYSYSLTNNLTVPVTLNAVGVVGRLGSVGGPNRDFGWQGPVTLAPNTTQQFSFSTLIQDTGSLYVWPAVVYQNSYVHYNNWGALLQIHAPSLTLTAPLTSSVSNPVAGQTTTLSATIRNDEDNTINITSLGIPVRYYGSYNYDTAWTSVGTLAPGATQSISGDVPLDKAGPYTAWVSSLIGAQYVTLSPNLNINVAKASPSFQLTYIETPDTTPALGEDVYIKFKLKNNSGISMVLNAVGVVGRYDNPYTGSNKDLGWVGPQTFAPGEEKTYTTFFTNISELKNYYLWVAINYQGTYIHYNAWGFMLVPHVPNLSLSAPISINSGNPPVLNQNTTITATVKNNEPHPINFNSLGIPVRYYSVYNYDATWVGSNTIPASGQSGDSVNLNGSVNFNKPGPYTIWASINIQGKYITIGTPINLNL